MMFDEAVKLFLYDNVCRGNAKRTVEYYDSNLRRFGVCYPEREISDFTVDIVKDYIYSLMQGDLSNVSVATYARALKAFFMWCNEQGYVTDSFRKFKIPKQSKTVVRILSAEEMKAVFHCFNRESLPECRNALLLYLMLDCGLRRSECFRLRLADCLDEMLIITGKGDKQRSVPVSKQLRLVMDDYLNLRPEVASDILLITRSGLPLSDTAVKRIFTKVKQRTGIQRIHPHLLRHSFATHFLMNGGDIFSLQAILGHETLDMVKRYSHLSKTYLVQSYSIYSPLSNIDL